MLVVRDLEVRYGSAVALTDVRLDVPAGRIVALLGPNGAGKSTLLRAISGLIQPAKGSITFDGRPLAGLEPHRIVRLGISHVPEGRRVFPDLTVAETLRLGAMVRSDRHAVPGDLARVLEVFPLLKRRYRARAATLSGGEQQMLALARSLMSRPRLLIVDELSLGLAPKVVAELFGVLRGLNESGLTMLVVEQNAYHAMSLASLVYVLESGVVRFSGTSEELRSSDSAAALYLGDAPA